MVWFYLRWEFEKADREFQRAEQINPRYATAQQWWGLCIGARGQFAQATAKMRRALELDPLAPIFTHNLAWIQMWDRDWNEALATAQSGLDFAPDFFQLHQSIGLSQLSLNHPEEAVDALRKALQMSNSASFAHAYLAYGLGRTGHKTECQAMIDEWLGQARQRYIPPTDIAIMYLGADNHEEAIAWLEKGYEQRDVWMAFLAVLPFWDPIRDDPRFADLVRRVGLPDLSTGNAPKDPSNLRPTP
jgi:serine/threonine-protein kinase